MYNRLDARRSKMAKKTQRDRKDNFRRVEDKKTAAKKKRNQYLVGIGFGVLIVAIIVILIVVLNKKPQEEPEVKRFEDLIHISLKEYKALLGDEESDDDLAELDLDKIPTEFYVFVYNPDYEECPWCEELEEKITEIALKYQEENDKNIILVMNYQENPEIEELYDDLEFPLKPVLIYIIGDKVEEKYVNKNHIEIALRELE
jgi:hypothetical protein